jgi:hypothetical protein
MMMAKTKTTKLLPHRLILIYGVLPTYRPLHYLPLLSDFK